MKSRILIVDDVPRNIQVIASHLGDEEYDLTIATSGEAALDSLKAEKADLILLDVNMPGLSGYEVCKKLKKSDDFRGVPVIFLTARSDVDDVVKGFNAGAVDYVTKPFNQLELKARVKTHLELSMLREELIIKNRELKKAALTDPLTKLENRRSILKFLTSEKARISRGTSSAGIILFDIDNFKSFNDTYGHEAGDRVLIEVSDSMRNSVRVNDRISRWGGEEILVVLPETSLQSTMEVAEKIRANIEGLRVNFEENLLNITVTGGVSSLDSYTEIDSAINRADEALYQGKGGGKNRIC